MSRKITFPIGPTPKVNEWVTLVSFLNDLRMAIESLLGYGKSASPNGEKAVTGNDLVTLGLITEDDLRKL